VKTDTSSIRTVCVWHVGDSSLTDAMCIDAEKGVTQLKGFSESAVKLIRLGVTRGTESEPTDKRVEGRAPCIVLLHGDEDVVKALLEVAPAARHDDDGPLVSAAHAIDRLGLPLFPHRLVTPVDHALAPSERGKFAESVKNARDTAPRYEKLKNLQLVSKENLPSKIKAMVQTDQKRSRRKEFSYMQLFLTAFIAFVVGTTLGTVRSCQEVVEVERVRVETERIEVPPAHALQTAMMRYSRSQRDYACFLAGVDGDHSFWLCPLPDSWINAPEKQRLDQNWWRGLLPNNWHSPNVAEFQVSSTDDPEDVDRIQVIAAVQHYLILALPGLTPDADLDSQRYIDLRGYAPSEVKLANPDAEVTKQLLALFPELDQTRVRD
jgi:hypothetical protein